jgi:hypothetical protein
MQLSTKESPMKHNLIIRFTAAVLTLSAITLSGCASLDGSQPTSPAMVKRGAMTAAEIEFHLRAGLPSNEIIAALQYRGAEPVGSEDVEALRRVGASHALINTILQINQPERYVWVVPPRFSVFFGRSGWYWVDSFGWPVYPQPHSGWSPRHWGQHYHPVAPVYIPVKPSPKQQVESDKGDLAPVAPVKPSPRAVEKDPPAPPDKKVSEKPVPDKAMLDKAMLEKQKREQRTPPNEK